MKRPEDNQVLLRDVDSIIALAYHNKGWSEIARIALNGEISEDSRGLHHSFNRYKLALIAKTFYECNRRKYHRINGKFVTERLCRDILSFFDAHEDIKERLSIKGQRAVHAAVKSLTIGELIFSGNSEEVRIDQSYVFLDTR